MSTKKKGSKNRSSHERRTSKAAPKSFEEKQRLIEQERDEREKLKKKKATADRGKKIMAIVFSALLIIAFAIPSITALSTCSQNEKAASTSEGYEEIVAGFEAELAADPTKTAAYLSIGNAYYEWAEAVRSGQVEYAAGEKELYKEAIANYESYLASGEKSDEATINLALSYYYAGDGAKGLDILKSLTEQEADNAMAWARLAFIYSYTGDNDNAVVACNKAIELDPNDASGAKTVATELLAEIKQ